jgi:hypothetical protein
MSDTIALRGEAAEVVLAEAQAVRSMVRDEARRQRLADLIALGHDGEVLLEDADALCELLELGLQTGRIRALYGPSGEQAALRLFRKLPRGADLAASAREVSDALGSLAGGTLDKLELQASAPGAYLVSVSVGGRELSVRLDRQGARIVSVGI